MSESEYIIISDTSLYTLQAKVSDKVRDGFEPVGGITFVKDRSLFIQAMFKREPEFG